MLIVKLIWDLQASTVDDETAFLHGGLQGEICINVPKGKQLDPNSCLLLKKTMYGLVQSAGDFYDQLLSTLKSMGFIKNKLRSCLLS
jgi:Reverse transcriptase (RNA-dependent DNA polymerase)